MKRRDGIADALSNSNRYTLVMDTNTNRATKGSLDALESMLARAKRILMVSNISTVSARTTGLLTTTARKTYKTETFNSFGDRYLLPPVEVRQSSHCKVEATNRRYRR